MGSIVLTSKEDQSKKPHVPYCMLWLARAGIISEATLSSILWFIMHDKLKLVLDIYQKTI